MDLDISEIELIHKEDQILKEVINSLENQIKHYKSRSKIETERSRELTSRIVASRRDEDKAMLASDEAVSHALEARNQEEIKKLSKLIKRPYFARIELHEEDKNGKAKHIEYKIGYSANTDCRIIDWKKAPISKLFYEYKEGDEYFEEIQGTERSGKITVKNTYEIRESELQGLTCKLGNFKKKNGNWIKVSKGSLEREPGAKDRMRDVLALISPEQFRAITEDASTAVLIQGIAGSGKTTVALHRLAWLLEPLNSELNPSECLILTQTNSLKTYVSNTLGELDVENVNIFKTDFWSDKILSQILPEFQINNSSYCPASIERLKKSIALLNCIEEFNYSHSEENDIYKIFLKILSNSENVIKHDETKLIDKKLVEECLQRSELNYSQKTFDAVDKSILIRIYQLKYNQVPLSNNNYGKYKHIVIDEVQDSNAIELASIINSVDNFKNLTIVGDTSQNTQRESTFPGWDKLRKYWDHKDELSTFIELKISHRSTLQIMKLADHIQNRRLVTHGREGRVPIWFRCQKESQGIESAIKWLNTALERYPNTLSAVLCANSQEAKFAESLLRPTFGNSVRLASDDSFSFDAGIIVCEIKHVKGLEFFNVMVWNPSEKNFSRENEISRNLLYIAVTRAEENLCLVTWGRPSGFLPDVKSPLVRGHVIVSSEE